VVTTRKRRPQRPREVVNVVDVTRTMLPPRGHVEVRERRDGTYRVWYPDEGWIPCPPVCDLKHSHNYRQGHVESFYHPTSLEDAMEWAYQLAEGREVKVVPVNPGAVKRV
jgi:hypothetical protein